MKELKLSKKQLRVKDKKSIADFIILWSRFEDWFKNDFIGNINWDEKDLKWAFSSNIFTTLEKNKIIEKFINKNDEETKKQLRALYSESVYRPKMIKNILIRYSFLEKTKPITSDIDNNERIIMSGELDKIINYRNNLAHDISFYNYFDLETCEQHIKKFSTILDLLVEKNGSILTESP